MKRALLGLVMIAGCAGATSARPDRDRLRALMGRHDHLKLQIQLATHAPDERLNPWVREIEASVREAGKLRPFGDGRDLLPAERAGPAARRFAELSNGPWTAANVRERFRALEAACAGCPSAFEGP